ncbi:MAG: hypothetical protein A2355_03810 [Spirochaetes bacterium RIFOXYB1_FULL_32_8]|nr:MAG: hypothetical protein A2Y29_08955 [Spirochaetes bacterium GWE2_31_10]OHD73408.1 MAG: hypothetical protein A2355_03810 [Spirochaetes bacterium RIFOXYB1_FULL_32_8]HBD94646.1 hypothetical protein [Spirochaetia bacterium]HBI39238.1 hypothetical protein [Spirochaetia bacterium]
MSQKIADEIASKYYKLTGIHIEAVFMNKGKDHKPTQLSRTEKGVYVFLLKNGCCFKVGKAGIESQARWNSHHYSLDKNTPSTFSKSLLNDLSNFKNHFDENSKETFDWWDKILKEKLGENYKVSKKTLTTLAINDFNDIKKVVNIKDWILLNICRIEFKIAAINNRDYDIDLLEKLVTYELRPIYEGKKFS